MMENEEIETQKYIIKYPKIEEKKVSMRIIRFLRRFNIKLEKTTGIIYIPKDKERRRYLDEKGNFIDILENLKNFGATLIPINSIGNSFKEETLFLMRFFQNQNKILKEKGMKFTITEKERETFRKINQKLKEVD